MNGETGDTRSNTAVFCGSSSGQGHDYRSDAYAAGQSLAQTGRTLIYGGGRVGLMGAVADGCLEAEGAVVGIMPKALVDREIAHDDLTELVVVSDMHQRKAAMADRSDAFVALPGGSGTLEEFFEQWTWAQLGHHQKPVGLLNTNHYFDPLLATLDTMVHSGFLGQVHRDMLFASSDFGELLEGFDAYEPPPIKDYEPKGP